MLTLTAVLNVMCQVTVHGLCTCLVKTVGLPSTLRDGPLEKLWGGWGIFERQEFFFVIKFLV